MNWEERIIIDPAVLVGKPVIKETRLAVEFIVELLANGWTEQYDRTHVACSKRLDLLITEREEHH